MNVIDQTNFRHFSECKNYSDGSIITIDFDINYIDSTNYRNVKQSICSYIANISSCDNMVRNIIYISTLLQDFKFTNLTMTYTDAKGNKEYAEYTNGLCLEYYEYDGIVLSAANDDNIHFKIQYTSDFNLDLSFINSDTKNLIGTDTNKIIIENFSEILSRINELKNISSIKLNMDALNLLPIYKLFYNEIPDFSNDEIKIRIQFMITILSHFGLVLNNKYTFDVVNDLPISKDLSNVIEDLLMNKQVVCLFESLEIAHDYKTIINFVVEELKKVFGETYNSFEVLKDLSKELYEYNNSTEKNISMEKRLAFIKQVKAKGNN